MFWSITPCMDIIYKKGTFINKLFSTLRNQRLNQWSCCRRLKISNLIDGGNTNSTWELEGFIRATLGQWALRLLWYGSHLKKSSIEKPIVLQLYPQGNIEVKKQRTYWQGLFNKWWLTRYSTSLKFVTRSIKICDSADIGLRLTLINFQLLVFCVIDWTKQVINTNTSTTNNIRHNNFRHTVPGLTPFISLILSTWCQHSIFNISYSMFNTLYFALYINYSR